MEVKVPATTTNFGSGFDTFGLALDLYNSFEFEPSDRYRIEVEGYGGGIPKDEGNLIVRVYKRACEVFGLEEVPLFIRQRNNIPPARGLGSSATAIVGGIEICCALHRKEIPLEEKMRVAFEFEPHPDNLLPAFLGGFVICVTDTDLLYHRLPFPEDLLLVFAVPDFEVPTEKAREVLKREVRLEDAVFNLRRASLLVSSLLTGRYDLLRYAVQDKLHQPYRSVLVKGFEKVVEEGYSAGAYAVFLSGAGPSVCAITTEEGASRVGEAMKRAFEREGVGAFVLKLKASEEGASWTASKRG